MKEPIAKIVVQNPALATSFTAVVGVIPTTMVSISHNLSLTTKYWILGIDIAIMLALIMLAVYAATKRVELILREDALELYKKSYPLDEIVFLKYNPRNRFLQVKNRRNLRSFNIYLGKKEEVSEKVAILQQWALQVGVNFQN